MNQSNHGRKLPNQQLNPTEDFGFNTLWFCRNQLDHLRDATIKNLSKMHEQNKNVINSTKEKR